MREARRMDEDRKLYAAGRRQKRPGRRPDKLGEAIFSYLGGKHRKLEANAGVVDVWREILPEQFYDHCELTGIEAGVLRLEVDPGPYMHELQVSSGMLLEQLQQRCPRAGIRQLLLRPRRRGGMVGNEQE